MDYYNEEKEPYILNYLALAYTIIGGSDVVPDIAILKDRVEAKKRIAEIKKIRAAGGKTELEQQFRKWEHNKSKHKIYVYDIDINKTYVFDSKIEAIKGLKINTKDVYKLKEEKLINDKYIISPKKIKIKPLRTSDFTYILETGYPRGLYYIETSSGREYLSIDSRGTNVDVKKHDCKEAAILHLLDIGKEKVRT